MHIGRIHGFGPRRGDEQQIEQTGKFGRMFPKLPSLTPSNESLIELGKTMILSSPDSRDPDGDNQTIPAGYTYLGQFIDHDITFDITSLHETLNDPSALRNFRTPMLDLDSLYGAGPAVQPYLYQLQDPALFLIGQTTATGEAGETGRQGEQLKELPNDLPRAPITSLGLIADPRNDENLIVSQIHVAFLNFHNKVVEKIRKEIKKESPLRKTDFEEARDIVIWHYQWIILHDFLRRLLDNEQLDLVMKQGPSFYNPIGDPFIPLEFSAAAYRVGHSMVRSAYDYNRVFTLDDISTDSKKGAATLQLLFEFTVRSGSRDTEKGLDPNLQPTLPSNWVIDWRRFFEIDSNVRCFSRKIDPFLVDPLATLPAVPEPRSLAVRNLLRGHKVGLPSGQSVARFMRLEPLTEVEISQGPDGEVAKKHGFHIESPLWYYILKEAQIQGKGEHLGKVGSRIVAEVFVGILKADRNSFLARKPEWQPTLPAKQPGTFTMADLLTFVGDINPIGD